MAFDSLMIFFLQTVTKDQESTTNSVQNNQVISGPTVIKSKMKIGIKRTKKVNTQLPVTQNYLLMQTKISQFPFLSTNAIYIIVLIFLYLQNKWLVNGYLVVPPRGILAKRPYVSMIVIA